MKKISLIVFAIASLTIGTTAQELRGLDKSPMDMAYYPDNFAHDRKFAPKLVGDSPALVRVIYSRPAKKDREVFGKLEAYDKVWRLGANEATEIKFYKDVTIGGKMLKAGTYAMFAIPNPKEWTIIFNSELDHWGAYSYDEKNDVLRITAPVAKAKKVIENFTIQFSKKNEQEAIMTIAWDETMVEVPIVF